MRGLVELLLEKNFPGMIRADIAAPVDLELKSDLERGFEQKKAGQGGILIFAAGFWRPTNAPGLSAVSISASVQALSA